MIAVPLSFAYRFFQRAPETSTADQRPAITIKAAQGYVHELVEIIASDFRLCGRRFATSSLPSRSELSSIARSRRSAP
jgi:hypothetical protein